MRCGVRAIMRQIALVLAAACHAASPAPPASPPDLAALRAALAARGDPFDARAREHGCPADQDVRAYAALLVHHGSFSPDGDVHRLTGGCGGFPEVPLPIDPPADAAYWFCALDAYSSDPAGDSPWHYALHVRARKQDGALDLATVACPGA
jgi:hypothetical protein